MYDVLTKFYNATRAPAILMVDSSYGISHLLTCAYNTVCASIFIEEAGSRKRLRCC